MEKLVSIYAYAADLGSCVSQFKLAQCYEAGLHIAKDMQAATDLYLKSAEQNYSPAIAKCIDLYLAHEIAGEKLARIVANAMPRKLICHAFDFFNFLLFDGELKPLCIATDIKPCGKFKWNGLFLQNVNRIHINPNYLGNVSALETLVHEMVHYWCFRFPKKKQGIHDKIWKDKMRSLGLSPVGKYKKWWQIVTRGGHFYRARTLFLNWVDSVAEKSSSNHLSDIFCPNMAVANDQCKIKTLCKDCILIYMPRDVGCVETYKDAFAAYCRTFLENNLFYAAR